MELRENRQDLEVGSLGLNTEPSCDERTRKVPLQPSKQMCSQPGSRKAYPIPELATAQPLKPACLAPSIVSKLETARPAPAWLLGPGQHHYPQLLLPVPDWLSQNQCSSLSQTRLPLLALWGLRQRLWPNQTPYHTLQSLLTSCHLCWPLLTFWHRC